MQATKDKSILFTAEMVRAILAGTKTQTRRIVKPQPVLHDFGIGGIEYAFVQPQASFKAVGVRTMNRDRFAYWHGNLPYGLAGDRLYVKETFCPRYWGIEFRADVKPENEIEVAEIMQKYGSKWKSARFMPRTASRITLEIVSVKVERLQDISESDAIAEGVVFSNGWYQGCKHSIKGTPKVFHTAKDAYRTLWDDINGKKEGCDWESNPFVFAIEFKRIEA